MNLAWLWAGFVAIMAIMMVLDLGVLNRRAHALSIRHAAVMTALWWILALAFAGAVALAYGREKAMQFIAGYVLEQSLSIDNLFVFILVFHYFAIPAEHQPRVLLWGIIGAILMRFAFIFAGVKLVHASHLVFYVFGAVLIWTGGKMLAAGADAGHRPDMKEHGALRLLHRVLPVTESTHGQSFFTRISGAWHATPLFAALVVVEATDLVFALDSIPAALGVTSDLFVVYTSNIFAVMGLRSMYFLLAGSMQELRYLKAGVSIVLCFVGAKMLAQGFLHVPTWASLAVIVGVLGTSVGASLLPYARRGRY